VYRKGVGWVVDHKALQRLREREFREHCASLRSDATAPDTTELQAEPIEARASGEPCSKQPVAPPPQPATAGAVVGSSLSGRYRTAPAVPRLATGSTTRGKRKTVAMPVTMPPLPPKA
jgi:hypothetical protein